MRHGADKLITRRPSHGPGVELVDGATSGPPFLPRMNDPTRGGTRLQPNVELTPGGWVKVAQRRVPAFDLAADLEGNIGAELRLSYGGNTCGIASDANFATVASAASSEEEEAKDARLRAEAEAAQAAGAPIVGADPSTYSPSN